MFERGVRMVCVVCGFDCVKWELFLLSLSWMLSLLYLCVRCGGGDDAC